MSKAEKNSKALHDLVKVAASGGPILPEHLWYEMSTLSPEAGTWYFGAECPHCQRAIAVICDFSNGRLGNAFTGTGGFVTDCPSCQRQVRMPLTRVGPFQWG